MIQKEVKFFKRTNWKIRKRTHTFKGFLSFYNVETLNSFDTELQLKGTETAIKNKLKK